jgi:hypothetical protein
MNPLLHRISLYCRVNLDPHRRRRHRPPAHPTRGTARSDRKTALKVREHKILGPYVEGLRTFAVSDFAAIQALIDEGASCLNGYL